MKESETFNLSPAAPSAPRGARYRYFSNPPATVRLRLADLASQIPQAARLPAFDAGHSLELPCEDVFAGPVPKLLLSRLAEIAAEHVRFDSVPDSPIRLPAAQLALGYRFTSGRELLEEPVLVENSRLIPEAPSHPSEDFTPNAGLPEPPESSLDGKQDSVTPECDGPKEEFKSPSSVARLANANPTAAPDAAPPGSTSVAETVASVTAEASLEESKDSVPSRSAPEAQAEQESTTPTVGEGLPGDPPTAAPEAWRPMSIFPIFRRKVVEPETKSPQADGNAESPKPALVHSEFSPVQAAPPPGESAGPEPKTAEPAAKEFVPAAPAQEAVLVEIEHLGKFEPRRSTEIPDQDALQALFLTEEFLSVDRVVELCGGLPGIKSCVLAHGSAVLASHNVPDSIDLVSLSAHALEMLAGMRQSAARMGVGAVPAVTIHSEKGPITFFHQDDLCLLVMHKDRGFVPGVREKLQKVVERLSEASLNLPVAASRAALAPKEATF